MKVETWITYASATAATGAGLAGERGGEKFTKIKFVADRGFQDGAGDDEEIVGAALAYSVACDGEWSATQVLRIIERLPA